MGLAGRKLSPTSPVSACSHSVPRVDLHAKWQSVSPPGAHPTADLGTHGHDAADSATSLHVSDADGCGEVGLRWTQSTDDQDPQSAIRYRIFINGAPDPVGIDAIGVGRWVTYGVVDGENTFVLRAIDSAGNVSARATRSRSC
jgi:hypothetical protein